MAKKIQAEKEITKITILSLVLFSLALLSLFVSIHFKNTVAISISLVFIGSIISSMITMGGSIVIIDTNKVRGKIYTTAALLLSTLTFLITMIAIYVI